MALSIFGRLRALPTLALALMLTVGLAGCGMAEPADDATAEKAATESETPSAPSPEPAEAAPEFETQAAEPLQKDLLVASLDSYSDGFDEPSRTVYGYDEAGRLTSSYFEDTDLGTTWTYDERGNLLTEVQTFDNGEGGVYTSTVTYTYSDENLPLTRTYETNQSPVYINPETGEQTDDPSQGEPMMMDIPKCTYEWSERGAMEKVTEYDEGGAVRKIYETTYLLPLTVPVSTVSVDPFSEVGIGTIVDQLRILTNTAFSPDGTETSKTTWQYNEAGKPTLITQTGGMSAAQEIAYNEQGDEVSSVFGDWGYTQEWTYDDSGRPTARAIFDDTSEGPLYEFYTYDSQGRLKAEVGATPWDGTYVINCGVYHYVENDEDLPVTPQQLMDESRARIA